MKLIDYGVEWVFVELTNACNMHCTFCPSDLITRKKCSMLPEIFRKTIDELSDLKVHRPIGLHVVGEPLLNKNIFKYIDYCKQKGVTVSLFTNGILLAENAADICKRDNILVLTISIQTPSLNSYKMRKSPVTFEDYLNVIYKALNYIIKTKTNERMRVELHLADTRGVPYWHVLDNHADAALAVSRLAKTVNYICSLNKYPYQLPEIPENLFDTTYKAGPNIHFVFKHLHPWGALVPEGYRITEAKAPVKCTSSGQMLCILADGTITVCCLDSDGELSLGNIMEISLFEALNSDARGKLLLDVSSSKNCRKCKGAIIKDLNGFYSIEDWSGFYSIEDWSGIPTYWMKADASIVVNSPENRTATLGLNALSFYRNRTLEISSNGVHLARVAVPTGFVNVSVPMHLAKGANTIRLHVPDGCERPCDIKELNNADSRCLSIAVQNVRVT